MVGVGEFQRRYGFRPTLHHLDLLAVFGDREMRFNNDGLYALAKRLPRLAEPSDRNEYDKRWISFHVPLRRDGRIIAVPMWAVEYGEGISFGIPRSGSMVMYRGSEALDHPERSILLRESIRLARILKRDGMPLLKRLVPYDYRTGRILGRYLLDKTMTSVQRKRHLDAYDILVRRNDQRTFELALRAIALVPPNCNVRQSGPGREALGSRPLRLLPTYLWRR